MAESAENQLLEELDPDERTLDWIEQWGAFADRAHLHRAVDALLAVGELELREYTGPEPRLYGSEEARRLLDDPRLGAADSVFTLTVSAADANYAGSYRPGVTEVPSPYGDLELRRCWFEWSDPDGGCRYPFACGVTAYSREDALTILRQTIYADRSELPGLRREIDDVDLSKLEIPVSPPPVMVPIRRGIWYPSNWRGEQIQ